MICPNCGAGLADLSQYCNHCGQAQQFSPPESFSNSAEGGEQQSKCYQAPTGDQNPQQPIFGNTGGTALSGKNNFLFLAVCCFGWAALAGAPRFISFLTSLIRGSWELFSWSSFSGFFNFGLHLVLPLAAGLFFLSRHRQNNDKR